MYYPDDLVEEIRLRSDVVDIIGSYVHLKKSGANYVGLCPFHNEKTGSFTVSPIRQTFKCFGCGVGGNVITFLMKYENMTFQETIKFLADRAGVKLPEFELSVEKKKENSRKQRILDVNREAAKYYYSNLRSSKGQIGRDYFLSRGLSEETIKNFGLGFAPSSSKSLYSYLKSLPDNFDDEILRASGIFNFSEKYGVMDKFWNRVIFPIMDANNKVIAFGGRLMSEGAIEEGDKKIPKYLNSPETEVFDKSRTLYGLNIAKRTRADYFILCEGYMDVIALHQAGFDMAIASLGTAFTSGHANLIRRYQRSKKVYLSYDSDEAGIKAALRAIPILRAAGITAKIINMDPYKDPDEFIKNLGKDEYVKRIENAEGSFFFEIRMLERNYDLKDPDSKTKFCIEIADKIALLEEEIERNNYTEAICEKYKLSANSLSKLVVKQAMKADNIKERTIIKSGIHNNNKESAKDSRKSIQKALLSWILDEPMIYPVVREYISPSDFSKEYVKPVELLFEQIEKDPNSLSVATIISCFTEEEEQTEVTSLFMTQRDAMLDEEKPESLKRLITKVLEQSLERMNENVNGDDFDALTKTLELKKQIDELKKKEFKLW